ncbi:YSIRK-type signal peptide-containing protein [Carnobacterium divergens]
MVSKNNKKILTEKNSNKVTKYKLKKFKVGLTSVAVGSLMFVGVGQVDVLAAETNIVDKVVVSESLEKAVVEVNKTDLTYTIKSVGNILASEKDYTVESFNTLVAAFDAATAVYDNEEATQADADQANVALQSAVESLEKAVVEVNKTDLTYTIKSVGNILASEKDYTVESFNTLVAAFDAATAVYDNEEATQADADQANVALQSAVESLEKAVVEVNKTDLTYTIKSVGNILASEKDYTVESFNTLVAAFDAATAVYDNEEATQADADQANVALQSAVESLEKAVVEVNKTDLTYTIKSVGNILASEKDYTVESFNTLVAAFDAATAVYDNEEATQADADQANVALQSAVESLEKAVVEVNKTDLTYTIKSVGNILASEKDYTVESFNTLVAAFDAATAVYDNEEATQADADQANVALQSAVESLEKAVVEVNKTDLYDVIISVGNIVTHENDFTVESFDNMGNAFDAATTVYDNKNATQAEVDQVKTDLQSAIEALEKAVVVDKADLYDVIISVGNIVTHENDFTVESFENVVNAHDAATTVYDNKNATQAEVDQVKTDLQSAIEALEKAVVVDKADLYDVIISVGNIVTHENDFTVESFENVVNAHDAATTVYDNKNATQAEVDQVKTDLQSAIEALEKAVVVDKADLYDVIISVGNIVTHENDFTVESFDNMGNAFDVATTVYDNKNATQAEVDQAKTDLQSAIEALEKAEKSTDLPLPELEPSKPTAPEVTVDDKKESIDPTLEESEPLKPVKSEVSAALEAKKTEKNEGEMLPKTSTATFSLGALGLVSLFGGAVSSFKKK